MLVTFAKDELMSTKPILLRLLRYAAGLKPNAAHRHSIDLSLSAALAANGILLIEELEKIKKKQLKDVVTLLHGNGNRASLWTTHSDLSHCIRDPTLQLRGIMVGPKSYTVKMVEHDYVEYGIISRNSGII